MILLWRLSTQHKANRPHVFAFILSHGSNHLVKHHFNLSYSYLPWRSKDAKQFLLIHTVISMFKSHQSIYKIQVKAHESRHVTSLAFALTALAFPEMLICFTPNILIGHRKKAVIRLNCFFFLELYLIVLV